MGKLIVFLYGVFIESDDMNRMRKLILLLIILLILLCLGSLYISKHSLTVTPYEISTNKLSEPLRIVQITDLHNSQFGEHNELLIEKVAEQEPDLIVLTGDLLNSDERELSPVLELIRELSNLAPTYASYGNHEKQYEKNYDSNLTVAFEQEGAHVLDFAYEDVEINGQQLRLGGLYGYCTPAKFLETKEADPEECAFLEEFQSTENYSILLTHMPFAWIVNDGISEWNVDCVFTGHDHGGLIRMPVIGGLYAPDQGLFPGKDCGLYYSKDKEKVMVLSRGLGKSGRIPRFNNVPEIVVADILPE